jgi:general L-amino acid transport system ATP-binding protein
MADAQAHLIDNRDIDRSQMTVSDEIAISISGMNKWYGTFHVLRDINLTVNRGERIVICGPVGFGQIHPDPLHQRAGRTPEGPDHRRRHPLVQ